MTTVSAGGVRAEAMRTDASAAALGVTSPDASAANPSGVVSDSELGAVLEPMLAALVRLTGAEAGTISVIGTERAPVAPVVAVGLETGRGLLQAGCSACAESRDRDSECRRSDLCGHDERIPADTMGPVCKHVAVVPLRHKDRPVGTVSLRFAAPCALPLDMTPLLRAAGDLVGMTLENARLARENLRIRLTSERQMLANEVHDSLAQGLTYMRMRMSLLRDAIRQNDELRTHKYCVDIDETLGNSQRRLRELITYFRSRMDPQGLQHALQETSDRFFARTGIALDFDNRVPDLYLPPGREIEVFHVVQEALANISRHAHATRAKLLLERRGANYVVVVEDDGVGIDYGIAPAPEDDAGHYGIAIMRERASRLGGTITLRPAAERGTRLELAFPVVSPRHEAPE